MAPLSSVLPDDVLLQVLVFTDASTVMSIKELIPHESWWRELYVAHCLSHKIHDNFCCAGARCANTAWRENYIAFHSLPLQHRIMLQDNEKWPPQQTGVYRGFGWEVKRDHLFSYYCGYIDVPDRYSDVSARTQRAVETVCHGGITFGGFGGGRIGFDCTHAYDYTANSIGDVRFVSKVFRTFPYVLSVIKRMIDAFIDTPS